ncbi:hypothetical protein P4O66_002443 [Electrophorus voltai]|uniref:Kinetochore protein SPC25 n=1 Tax=Electrophorus voltai TaxID=2609070 RepID=A0AAD9DPQ1_9TELE|nr:hypothetical protein P4O66_002443 [Electrophorus voltai]
MSQVNAEMQKSGFSVPVLVIKMESHIKREKVFEARIRPQESSEGALVAPPSPQEPPRGHVRAQPREVGMATIRDPDVGETFNSKLEEIRSKLLTQAMGEVMNDATAEFSQAHRHYMTSILVIDSQNKANKARLKNLNKMKEIFQERLSLEIRKIQGEKLQFIFRNINHKNPESAYTFLLRISEDGVYQMISCDPPLEQAVHLERKLQETNNFSAFLANVRKEFVALHNATKTA